MDADRRDRLKRLRQAVRAFPVGGSLRDDDPAARELLGWLHQYRRPVPKRWTATATEALCDAMADAAVEAEQVERVLFAAAAASRAARPARMARAGRAAAAKAASAARRAALSPLQAAVRAALVLLGADATHAAVVDALARRGYSHGTAAVSKARKALRQKGL